MNEARKHAAAASDRLFNVAPPMLEKDLQAVVMQLARLLGWKCAHFRPLQTKRFGWRTPVSGDATGWPDLVMVHPIKQHVLWRELKAKSGRVRPEQEAWTAWLLAAGQDYAIWTPADWPDRIKAELQADYR
jgi:hypothetical protein